MSFTISGLNHLGLVVEDIGTAKKWFVTSLGLRLIEDRGELLFIAVGNDILAIKTPRMAVSKPEHGGEQNYVPGAKGGWQALDHYGFFAPTPGAVDAFAKFAVLEGAQILKGPYDRSDGRAVYFRDPCGLVGEYLYYLPPK
jgi:catechol 2,3-dioxygenase-like lactoylglutathione lyase family enzyme